MPDNQTPAETASQDQLEMFPEMFPSRKSYLAVIMFSIYNHQEASPDSAVSNFVKQITIRCEQRLLAETITRELHELAESGHEKEISDYVLKAYTWCTPEDINDLLQDFEVAPSSLSVFPI